MCVSKMALCKYFKPINRSTLPLPSGPLSEIVPSFSIEAANKEVESIISQVEKSSSENDPEGNSSTAESKTMKRGPYVKFSQAKVAVAKYASEHGVAAALRHYFKWTTHFGIHGSHESWRQTRTYCDRLFPC